MNNNSKRNFSRGGGRKSRNTFVTKSGQTIKINRSLVDRIRARKDGFSRGKALRMAGMPKNPVKRFFYRLHPKRLYHYWFSREGGIMALKITGIGIVTGFLLLVGLFAYFRKDLPNLNDISGNNIGGSIRYYDRTGQTLLWQDYDSIKRVPVEGEEIAQFVKDATVAVEDKDFFKHGGFDVRGITRAAWTNITGGTTTQGGSTITQQLVKLTQAWTDERTYTRKVKELILSVEFERSYSKQDILDGYLNTAPYGNIQYGVETATRDYFQKGAKDLTLDEAAFLAAIPQSPSVYSPYGSRYNPERLVARQKFVLQKMREQGMITQAQLDEAKATDTLAKVHQVKPKYDGITAPWFVMTAKQEVEQRHETANRSGWKVITTLDLDLQRKAEENVQKGLPLVKARGGDTAAFVAEDVKTGQVVALVGGDDFGNKEYGENNYARAKLPPGSSIKPYDYLALMEHNTNVGAGSVLYDVEGPLEGYPCTNKSRTNGNCLNNYDFRSAGPITIRYALGGSRNIPAVKAMLITGVDKTIETAEALMGDPDSKDNSHGYSCYLDDQLTKEGPCYAASAIGDGAYLRLDEHVHGYTTLSRNGNNIPQTYILKIEDAEGETVGKEWKPTAGKQVVRPDGAYIIGDMLSDPNASYFSGSKPQRWNNGKGTWKFSLKTGTTNDAKDGWMMGYSTRYAAGVWVGHHQRQRAMSGSMESMTLPIWQGWMRAVHQDITPEEREKPSGVQSLPAYIIRSHVGFGSIEPSPANDLYPSWYQKKSTSNKKQTIDIISNKLATDCTPARARKDVTEGDPLSFSADKFAGRNTANTSESDDVHKCGDARPSISVNAVKVGNSYTISASASPGTHPLSGNGDKGGGKVIFEIEGNVIQTFDASSGDYTFSYTPDFSGQRTLTATVVDSVLYDGTATTTLAGNSSGLTILTPANGQDVNSGSVTVTWSGGSAPYTVRLNGAPQACNPNSNTCGVTLSGANGTAYTVTVSSGSDTASVTFTK